MLVVFRSRSFRRAAWLAGSSLVLVAAAARQLRRLAVRRLSRHMPRDTPSWPASDSIPPAVPPASTNATEGTPQAEAEMIARSISE
jgi:hypothetical protein